MRKSASFVAALVAAGSIAGTAYATATIGSQAITTLVTGSLAETSHPASSRSKVSRSAAGRPGSPSATRCCITQPHPDATNAPPIGLDARDHRQSRG